MVGLIDERKCCGAVEHVDDRPLKDSSEDPHQGPIEGSTAARRWWNDERTGYAMLYAWIAAVCSGVIVVSLLVSPEDIEDGNVRLSPPCRSKEVLGVECPACGMTRAFAALSRGRLDDAVNYNWGSPIAYALVWCGVVVGVVGSTKSFYAAHRAHAREANP